MDRYSCFLPPGQTRSITTSGPPGGPHHTTTPIIAEGNRPYKSDVRFPDPPLARHASQRATRTSKTVIPIVPADAEPLASVGRECRVCSPLEAGASLSRVDVSRSGILPLPPEDLSASRAATRPCREISGGAFRQPIADEVTRRARCRACFLDRFRRCMTTCHAIRGRCGRRPGTRRTHCIFAPLRSTLSV